MAEKRVKKRNWAYVLYPESLPEDWESIIQQSGLVFAVSPLHDMDVNESTGEQKKPHYHGIAHWEGPQTFSVAKELAVKLNAPNPIPCESVKGAYRYFTHQDNPEKAQYDKANIRCFNGFSITDFVEMTKSEEDAILKRLCAEVTERGFTEYSGLIDWLLAEDLSEEFSVASRKTIFLKEYIKGKWRNRG